MKNIGLYAVIINMMCASFLYGMVVSSFEEKNNGCTMIISPKESSASGALISSISQAVSGTVGVSRSSTLFSAGMRPTGALSIGSDAWLSIIDFFYDYKIDYFDPAGFVKSIKKLIVLSKTSRMLRFFVACFLKERLGALNLERIRDSLTHSDIFFTAIGQKIPVTVMQMLLDSVKSNVVLSGRGAIGRTLMHEALFNRDLVMARFLLSLFKEIYWEAVLTAEDEVQDTPLHYVAALGYPEGAQFLLTCLKNKSVALTERNKTGQTPFHEVTSRGCTETAQILLEWARNKQLMLTMKDNDYNTPLHHAARAGHDAMIHWLLGRIIKKRDALMAKTSSGNTPLHLAAWIGRVSTIKVLISYGADPGLKNNAGQTAYAMLPRERREKIKKIMKDALLDKKLADAALYIDMLKRKKESSLAQRGSGVLTCVAPSGVRSSLASAAALSSGTFLKTLPAAVSLPDLSVRGTLKLVPSLVGAPCRLPPISQSGACK